MIQKTTYYILVVLSLISTTTVSQTKIEILNADEIYFNKKINADRQVLIGNVKTKHQDRFLNCDSAYFYSNENKIEAFNNIHIWEGDSLDLKGDYLIYHGDQQLAEIHGNVKFTHNDMQLISKDLNYNFEVEIGFFDTKAIITQYEKSLTSDKGIYFSAIEKFNFYSNVHVESEKETLQADTLFYWLNTEYGEFKSNGVIINEEVHIEAQNGWINQFSGTAFLSDQVKITELKNNHIVYADTCEIKNQMKHSTSYGNTLVCMPLEDDTLFLTADTLIHFQEKDKNILKAYYKVCIQNSEILGSCDSLTYKINDELILLNKTPVLWMDEFQLTSDTLSIVLKNKQIHQAYLNKNAFISSELDSFSVNQISGINMIAHFNLNELSHVNVFGNGESIYFIEDDKTKKATAVNKIVCSNMNLFFANRAIHNISFFQDPDATLFPIDQISQSETLLKGYKWVDKTKIANKIRAKTQFYLEF